MLFPTHSSPNINRNQTQCTVDPNALQFCLSAVFLYKPRTVIPKRHSSGNIEKRRLQSISENIVTSTSVSLNKCLSIFHTQIILSRPIFISEQQNGSFYQGRISIPNVREASHPRYVVLSSHGCQDELRPQHEATQFQTFFSGHVN